MSDEKEESGADRFPRTQHASLATLEELAQANLNELHAKEDADKEAKTHAQLRVEADRIREKAEVEAFAFRFAYHLRQAMKQNRVDPQHVVGAAMLAHNLAPLVPSHGAARVPPEAIAAPLDDEEEKAHLALDAFGIPREGEWDDVGDEAIRPTLSVEERIRLLGNSWQRVKAAHTEAEEQVSRLLSEVTKRETAARDAALEEAARAILHAKREDRRDLYPERAEYEANFCGWTAGANAALDAIRALTSKPAPTRVKHSQRGGFLVLTTNNPREGWPIVINAVSVDAAQRAIGLLRAGEESKPAPQPSENPGELQKPTQKWEPDSPTDLPDEEQSPREPTPEKLRELFEHREAREEAARRLDALATSHVHDFGWALAQMRAGKKVRRPHWHTSCHLAWRENSVWDVDQVGRSNYKPFSSDWAATDWEVVE